MTDARYPDRWLTDRRILRLSDREHRVFTVALTWSVSNRTDGRLDAEDLPLIPGWFADALPGLERSGLFEKAGKGWLITVFADSQTPKAQLDGLDLKRRQDRARQAAKRVRDKGNAQVSSRDNPRDGHVISRVTTKARTGKASTGLGESNSSDDEADANWIRNASRCSNCGRPGGLHGGGICQACTDAVAAS